jgi:hypothetical protein
MAKTNDRNMDSFFRIVKLNMGVPSPGFESIQSVMEMCSISTALSKKGCESGHGSMLCVIGLV